MEVTTIRKYRWSPSMEDIEWVMIAFERRADIQIVPQYVEFNAFGSVASRRMVRDTECSITITNDKDDLLFKIKFPDAILMEQTWSHG